MFYPYLIVKNLKTAQVLYMVWDTLFSTSRNYTGSFRYNIGYPTQQARSWMYLSAPATATCPAITIDSESAATLVHAFVTSRIDYYKVLLHGGCTKGYD